MPEREYTAASGGGYAYGFNGKENSNEIYGDGNAVDFGARIYDGRLGRWMSLDPLMTNYQSLSSFCFAGNTPILFIDIDGNKFINPYPQYINVQIDKVNTSKALLVDFNRNHPNLNKSNNMFRRLFNKDYRSKHNLEKKLNDAETKKSEFEEKSAKVENTLYTLKQVDEGLYNKYENEETKYEITISNDKSGEAGSTEFDAGVSKVGNNIKLVENDGQVDITLNIGGAETLANELGNVEYHFEQVNTQAKLDDYRDEDNQPYRDRKSEQFSFKKEGEFTLKLNKKIAELNENKKNGQEIKLDKDGNLQKPSK
jgi:RHS repeat-associated protein